MRRWAGCLLTSDRKWKRAARFAAMRGFIIPRARFGGAKRFSDRAALRPEAETVVRDLRDLRAMCPSPR
jgi:hypothetical protein